MKLTVNNEDRSDEFTARIDEAIRQRGDHAAPMEMPADINALALRETRTETEYQSILIRMIRCRDNVDSMPFTIPHRGGWRGRCAAWVKGKLWHLLRYQHDRITFRQNLINSLYAGAMEFERSLHGKEIAALKARLQALEEQRSGADRS